MIEPLLKNRLTCLRALLLSESGFSRASLPFFSSSDLPVWGLTCGGPLLLSESAASSLFFSTGFLLFLPSLGSLQGTAQDGPFLGHACPPLVALPVWDLPLHFIEIGRLGFGWKSVQYPPPQVSIKCRCRSHTERATKVRQAWPKNGHPVWVCIAVWNAGWGY